MVHLFVFICSVGPSPEDNIYDSWKVKSSYGTFLCSFVFCGNHLHLIRWLLIYSCELVECASHDPLFYRENMARLDVNKCLEEVKTVSNWGEHPISAQNEQP